MIEGPGYAAKQYAGAAGHATPPSNPNFADSVQYADERVGVLLNRLGSLADRLVGTPPPEGPATALAGVPNGLLGVTLSRAGDIAAKADYGIEMIERIERQLP